jgi:hypothetical protein
MTYLEFRVLIGNMKAMERTETESILFEVAELAANEIRMRPLALGAFESEIRSRILRHGAHPVYRSLLRAIGLGAPAVIHLILLDSPNGDLVRSMAPFRTLISRAARSQIIARRHRHYA